MSATTFDLTAELEALRADTELVHRAAGIAHQCSRRRAERIVRLRGLGVPYRVLADAIGATVPAVQRIIARSGLSVAPVGGGAPMGAGNAATVTGAPMVTTGNAAMGAGATIGGAL